MKNVAKKILAVALGLMLTLPLAAFPASAATDYATAADGDLLYEVDFNGTSDVFGNIGSKYDGMTSEITNGGRTIELEAAAKPSTKGSVWSGEMLQYNTPGKSYTVVFTVEADDNQSVGIFLKWKDGFFVNPTANTYSVGHCSNDGANAEKYVEETSYNGTGDAKQTYAIEFASADTASGGKYECSAYKLYVVKDNAWSCIAELDATTRGEIAWNTTDYEFMVQLARVSDGNTNTGAVYVSDMDVYKGLVAEDIVIDEPDDSTPREYDSASDGDLLYNVNFNGDSVFSGAKGSWAGATVTKTDTSVTMSTHNDANNANRGSVWGADLSGYTIFNKSYTVVFTLTASDADEEIGFLPCDWAGFVITPGKNAYRFITTKNESGGTDGAYESKVTGGTYNGTGALTQTYAIELATSGTVDTPSVDAYNLYVAQGGEWVLVCSLTDIDESIFDWFYYDGGVYEEDFTMRLYRRGYIIDQDGWTTSNRDTDQDGTVTVSDAKIYKGLIATNELVDAPDTPGVENGGNGNNTGNNGNNNGQTDGNGNNESNKTDTSEDTEATTDVETEAETEEASSGCGGAIGIGGAALLVSSAIGMIGLTVKKKED